MPDAVYTILTGAGVAGIWLLCILVGWMHAKPYVDSLLDQIAALKVERDEYKAAAEAERRRADAAVEAAQTSNLLLAGIRREVGH